MTPLVPALGGALVVAGLIGAVYALLPAPERVPAPRRTHTPLGPLGARWKGLTQRTQMTILIGAGAGLVVALLTGWVIAVVLVPAAIIGIPLLLSAPPTGTDIARLEALEEWARSMSGKLTVGQSLRQALIRSLRSTPEAIEPEVSRLVNRLWSNAPTEQALRLFAEDLDDSTGDLVVANLILAARGRGTGLATALEALAESVAADVRARRQIEADQQKPRSTARMVTIITLAVLAILAFTGDYIEPYGTPVGQVVLVLLLSAYVGALLLLRRMAVAQPLPRFLDLETRSGR